ncbi:hypothetical protein HH310_05710 [Actinoplanes sp. TBRC 11911]|nr:hypothetical protein [Actinoplanes sp. TBRC 11911]
MVPLFGLAERTGLSALLDEHVRFADERIKSGAANASAKLTAIIAGMAAGADSIDDLEVIRAGGMRKLFDGVYTPATLGILLREVTHGHTRQLSAVLRRHLAALAEATPVLRNGLALSLSALWMQVGGELEKLVYSDFSPVIGRAKVRPANRGELAWTWSR